MESVSSISHEVTATASVEIDISMSGFYTRLSNTSKNKTTLGFPIERELGELTYVLFTRLGIAIEAEKITYRTLSLLQHHTEELALVFEECGIPPSPEFLSVSAKIRENLEEFLPSGPHSAILMATPEGVIASVSRKLLTLLNPLKPLDPEKTFPEILKLNDAIRSFYPSIEEFEIEERRILILSFRYILFSRLSPIYENISEGPISFSTEEFQTTLALALVEEPKSDLHRAFLEGLRIGFFPAYPEGIPNLEDPATERPSTHQFAVCFKSFLTLTTDISGGVNPDAKTLLKQLMHLNQMLKDIHTEDRLEGRRIGFVKQLQKDTFSLYKQLKLTPPDYFHKLSDEIISRLLKIERSYPEERIKIHLEQILDEIIPFQPVSSLEETALPKLNKILEYTTEYRRSYTYHDPIEYNILDKVLERLFFDNISRCYVKWLCQELTHSSHSFKIKIKEMLDKPPSRTQTMTLALKILKLVYFPKDSS